MVALKIVITVLFLLQMGFTQSPSPVNDAPCLSEDQNNCPSNSYCYIYSRTGQPYCAQSCDLNNGGCGTGQCMMVTVQCITAPCPPMVQCHSDAEICNLPPVVGDCDAAIRRFFFNSTSQRCEIFIYGGCGGNANNFVEESECARTCQSGDSVVPTLATRSSSQSRSGSIIPTHISRSSSHSHSHSGSVTPTHSVRPTRPSMSRSVTRATSTLLILPSPSSILWPDPYTCSLQPESGLCLAAFPRYFYNITSGRCEMFIYGGCGGNDNRFSTSEECYRTCGNFVNICELDPETGICEAYIPSYFYNATSKRCEEFIYGGCGGNANRFTTLDQCQATCDIDVCILEPEPGNCRGSFLRYFYNKFTGRCELFVYGGCGGNGNRFVDIRSCKKTCISSVPTSSPTPVVSEKNIISVMISSHGDLDGVIADFTGGLMKLLTDNGIKDISIQIVDISYAPDNELILSVAVYSDKGVISGDEIAALINQNKEMFTVPVSDAVVGGEHTTKDSENSDDSDGLPGGALAGIVIGAIVGLIFVVLLTMALLYIINSRLRIIAKHISTKKSDGLKNPIYSDNQME